MSFIGLAVSSSIFILAPLVLPWFLQGSFSGSIPVARIVVIALPFVMVNTVFYNSFYVLNKAKIVVWLFFVQALIASILNIFLIPKYSFYASAYITLFGEMTNAIAGFLLLKFFLSKKYENRR